MSLAAQSCTPAQVSRLSCTLTYDVGTAPCWRLCNRLHRAVPACHPHVGLQTMLHRPAPLTVPGVYKTLRQIALQKGQGSAARRQQAILGMLRSCR